jgi:polyhydroxybutyrate depolymerase
MAMADEACNPTRPVAVMHFHGLADEYAPFNGGPSKYKPAGVRRSVPESIALWVQMNGCSNETTVTYKKGAATCITYSNCRDETAVTLCTIEGSGHQWPGGKVQLPSLGPGTSDISATNKLIEFFQAHPMP